MMNVQRQRCGRCKVNLPIESFKVKRCGNTQKACLECNAKNSEWNRRYTALRKHQCDQCDAAFGMKGHLDTHVRTVHEKARDFKCDQCDKAFGSKVNFDTHVRTVHEQARDFKCDQCDKAFGSKGYLKLHVRVFHEKARDFKCDQCDKAFGLKGRLDKHIRTVHEQARDFKCDQCDKAFGQKSNLDRHVRMIHEKRKDFKCDQCDKAFGMKGELNMHSFICTGELTRCSGGELACMKALDAMGLSYTRDQTHEGLIGETGRYLRFDFVVEWKCEELVIEYDGQQHYKPVRFGGMTQEDALTAFEKLQRHDKLKDDYCASKGIPLLRIPYTKFGEIPQLITDFIVGNTDWGAEPEKAPSLLTDDELCAVLADFGI